MYPRDDNSDIDQQFSTEYTELDTSREDSVPLLIESISEKFKGKMNDNVAGFHCHCPDSDGERKASKQAQKRLLVACILCFLFMIGELMGGYYSGSLAIMSDAAHMFSDVGSFCISLFVIWLSGKGQRKTMTFGYYRAEALGALATVIIIWYITGILTYLAIQRIKSGDFEIEDDAMIGVAAAAVLFNITLGLCLNGMCFPGLLGEGGPLPGGFHGHSHGGHSRLQEEHGDVEVHSEHSHATEKHINIRAALIHVLGDFLQSVGVLFSSVLIKIFGDSCKVVDPICTLIFAVIVLFTTIGVLKDTLKILLEGTPRGIKYDSVLDEILKIPGINGVHDLNLWSLTADIPVASCHLIVNSSCQHSMLLTEVNKMLKSKFNISKTTIQIEEEPVFSGECKQCEPLIF